MQSMLSHYPRRTEVHIWDILHQSLLQNRRLFGPPKVPQKGLIRPYSDTCPSPRQAYESLASFSHPFCSASSSLVVLSLVSPSLLTFVPSELCKVLWLQLRSSFRLVQLCASPNHCNQWGNCCFLLQLLNRLNRLWLKKNQHLRKCSLRAVPARGHGRGRLALLKMVVDITLEAAMELKVWKLREWFVPFLRAHCRKASLQHKIRQHIEGQI